MGSSSSPSKRIIRVFIASPGDVPEERRAFKESIDELNRGFGRGADVEFAPLGWEDALAQVGRRSQSVINQDVDSCDAFVLVMWRRWGQEAPDAAPYTSYTEEEFYRALTRFEKDGSPEIFVFFKHIDPGQMADPGPQLVKVLAFRKKLEATRQVLYHGFKTVEEFKQEIDTHLVAYARGNLAKVVGTARVPLLPDSVAAEVEKHKGESQRAVTEMEKLKAEMQRALEDAEKARAEAKNALARAEAAENLAEVKAARRSVDLAEQATKAALDGNIEEARQGFAKALDGTTNLRVLKLGVQFFRRIGELSEADRLARRWLAISGPDSPTADTAAAYGALGLIYDQGGDFNQAEMMHKKALSINETLGKPERVAGDYANLGMVYVQRGNLDQAEAMLEKAFLIGETHGKPKDLAQHYGNLGALYDQRGNFGKAEELYRRSLEEAQRVGDKESIAILLFNQGQLAQKRGHQEEARNWLTQAATLFGQLGMSKDRDDCVNLLSLLNVRKK